MALIELLIRSSIEELLYSDYVLVTLRGTSSYACLGYSQKRLIDCSKMAGRSLDQEFGDGAPA
jgi:TetR/AcrR family transcriptional repressor for divergent bdcA